MDQETLFISSFYILTFVSNMKLNIFSAALVLSLFKLLKVHTHRIVVHFYVMYNLESQFRITTRDGIPHILTFPLQKQDFS